MNGRGSTECSSPRRPRSAKAAAGPSRVGRKTKDATRWKHRNYRGSVQLKRAASEVVTAKVQATTAEDERKLLSSFLGFVDRHSGDQVATITIHYW